MEASISAHNSNNTTTPDASVSTSHGSSMHHVAATRVAMPDKANAIDYKFSLVGAIVSLRADTALVEEFARFKMIK